MSQQILIAVDIEKTGSMLIRHKINSLGFYIEIKKGSEIIVESYKYNILVNHPKFNEKGECIDYGDFEERSWNEFWSKLPENIIQSTLNDPPAMEAQIVWNNINSMLNDLALKYPVNEYKYIFLSDNLSFDIANIDYALEYYCNRKPMRYVSEKYSTVISVSDKFWSLSDGKRKKIKENLEKMNIIHDHNPINDAKYILYEFKELKRYL